MGQISSSSSVIGMFARAKQGDDFSGSDIGCREQFQFVSSSTFQTSGQFSNLQSLPFVASFNSSSLAVGQNIYVSTSSVSFVGGKYSQATTITLMPQTIDGTIVAVSSSGNFQIYTVALAPNDFLAALKGATSVVVYVDSNSKMLNSAPLAPGGLFRFNGLIFNDNGTRRMDSGQVNDGVAE